MKERCWTRLPTGAAIHLAWSALLFQTALIMYIKLNAIMHYKGKTLDSRFNFEMTGWQLRRLGFI